MTREQWQQVRRIFEAVVDSPPEDREILLARLCREDAPLHREVVSLLASHEEADDFMEAPPDELAAHLFTEEKRRDLTGLTLGHYRLLSLIGEGGMGEVWLARDQELGRKAAVKLLPLAYTNDVERMRRFEREARAASSLNHPNILMVFEIGQSEYGHHIVMEFVEGETLRDAIRKRTLGQLETLDIAAQICGALAAAHDAGVIHRDIKPENLILRPDGYVKILDFGLAKLTEPMAGAPRAISRPLPVSDTAPGLILGTTSYMSPEQARGEEVDVRTDLFSFGVVLYEMITRRPPFTGSSPSDIIAAILRAEPEPLAQFAPGTPAELSRIVEQALRKARADRYSSAAEMTADLKRLRQRMEWDALNEPPRERTAAAAANRRGPGRRTIILLTAALVVALAVLAFSRFRAPSASIDSVAVLPFANETQEEDAMFLADGIADGLIGRLSQISSLKVMSLNSVARYKNQPVDARTVGRELNVRAVLLGRLAREKDRLRVSVELIDAPTRRRLWGRQYALAPGDLSAIHEEMAEEIAARLKLAISPGEQRQLANRHSQNEAAYQLYIRGRYQWNMRTKDSIRRAIEYFERAVQADDRFAPGWAGLADCYGLLSNYSDTSPAESMMRAQAAALRALDLDATLADAHTSLGLVKRDYDWDFDAAETSFQRAIELTPNYATAWQWRAENFVRLKRTDEAIDAMKQARARDPFSLIINSGLGWALHQARRYAEAEEQLRRTIQLDPSFARTHFYLGRVHQQQERFEEAATATREALRLSGDETLFQASLAHILSLSGKRDEARRILLTLQQRGRRDYLSPFALALIHIGLGETESAFALIETAERQKDPILVNYIRDPQLDPIRGDKRFAALLQRLRLLP